ncbi:MAG: tetratricopeptide repeat protein [Streptosporangiaceae bacterium]|jgi:tetratricopeptide (TPR) repeat protein
MFQPAVHRAILIVDVESFGDPARTNAHQLAVRAAMYKALRQSFARARISWVGCAVEDRGDGVLVLVPPEVPKSRLVTRLPARLADILGRHNAACPAPERIRLRMALHAGEVHGDAHGFAGASVNRAFRLIEAPPSRTALHDTAGVIALIVSDWFYDEVVRHYPAAGPSCFRQVRVVMKETEMTAWVRVLGAQDALSQGDNGKAAPAAPPELAQPGEAIPDTFRLQQAPVIGVTAAWTLPRDIPSFTGRQQELRTLVDAAGGGGLMSVHAIGGMAGVGKTALAVRAAHQLAPRFPDGQFFLSLHGHTPGQRPVEPADALASLLLTAGVPTAHIPPGLEARAALWRDRLAGRKMLLVLDDAAGSEQIRPLLPSADGSLVLVTSRRHLSALEDATTISLDTLPPDEAAALMILLADRPGLGPADPAVDEITRLCGYLPLAVGILARQLHHHPAWSLTERAAELAVAVDRLELMTTENVSVAAAFNLSYDDLTEDQQRLFRRLGLHPGTDVDAYAAAAVEGCDLATARRHLDALYDQHLLIERAHGRYQLHDLLRQHARTLAGRLDPDTDREQATARLLDYYQYTAALAETRLARQTQAAAPAGAPTPPAAVPGLPDSTRALAWTRAERANLLACLDLAERLGQDARVVGFTAAVVDLLRQDGPWIDARDRQTAAVQAAQRLGDPAGLAGALNNLGVARWLTDDHTGAGQALQEALSIYRKLGDRLGQANALNNLGHVRQLEDDRQGALQAQQEALNIYRDLGDRLGQGNALSSLGVVRRQIGDFQDAAWALEQALDIYRDIGDRTGQANALINLGITLWQSNDYQRAAAVLQEALEISRDLGDRLGEANALINLGAVWRQTGDFQDAAGALEQALAVYRDIGSRLGQGNALIYLGTIRRHTRDYRGAATALEQALGILREVRDQAGQAAALLYLGGVRRQTGDHSGAATALAEALGILHDIGDPGGETEALNEIGTLALVCGDPGQAEAYHRKALELAGQIDSPWDEAHARAGLGHCALAQGLTADAIVSLREAHEIFQRINAADADEVAGELDRLTGEGSVG